MDNDDLFRVICPECDTVQPGSLRFEQQVRIITCRVCGWEERGR